MVELNAAIQQMAEAYGIKLMWMPYQNSDHVDKPPARLNWGPMDAGLHMKRRIVYANDARPSDVFHEMVHVILGTPALKIDEAFVLMPFEYRLAQHLARRLSPGDSVYFMADVNTYQCGTLIDVSIGGHRRTLTAKDRYTKWWKGGLRRARDLGVLHSNGSPTYQFAKWPKDWKKHLTWTTDQ